MVGFSVINSRTGMNDMVCEEENAAEWIHFLNDVYVEAVK
jgi:hypothetical protein